MGIKPYLVSTATVGIIAQRLIKRICPKCKTEYTVETNEHAGIGIHKGDTLYRGRAATTAAARDTMDVLPSTKSWR